VLDPIRQDAIKGAPDQLLKTAVMAFPVCGRHVEFLLLMLMIASDQYANFWNYQYQVSKKWHSRWLISISDTTDPAFFCLQCNA